MSIEILCDDTISLCEDCCRHVPAKRFIRNGSIWLSKECPEHGYKENLVEHDAEFYVNYKYPNLDIQKYFDAVCLDITNHCNLTCPHCYQIPNNNSIDSSIETIINQIKSWKNHDNSSIVLMGAEPTTRKDLVELIEEIKNISNTERKIIILSNGVYLSKYEYAKKFEKFDNLFWTIGLNHPDYQGKAVRAKQERGLKNCLDLGLPIKNVSYTLESYDQLEYCINEILEFKNIYSDLYRIRVGTDIGRSPKVSKMFMSNLVSNAKQIAEKNNWGFNSSPEIGIRAHYPVFINKILIKLIQWPDIKTLDMREIQTESWADMIPGKPMSPLVHQVLLRDRLVNKNLPLLDTVSKEFRGN